MPGGLDLSARVFTARKYHSRYDSWKIMPLILSLSALEERNTHRCEDTGRSEMVFMVGISQSSNGTLQYFCEAPGNSRLFLSSFFGLLSCEEERTPKCICPGANGGPDQATAGPSYKSRSSCRSK